MATHFKRSMAFYALLMGCSLLLILGCGDEAVDSRTDTANPDTTNPGDSAYGTITVKNPGFETPALPNNKYNKKAEGWGATAKQSVWHVPADAYERADGSIKGGDGTQVAFLNQSDRIWQSVGSIEPNTVYRLTVAIGARGNDTPFGSCVLSLQTKSGGSDIILAERQVVYGEDFPESSRRSFMDFSVTFDSRDKPDMVNSKLFIVLAHQSGGQTNLDKVRLEKKQ